MTVESVAFVGMKECELKRLDRSSSACSVQCVKGSHDELLAHKNLLASAGLTVLYPDWHLYVPAAVETAATEDAVELAAAALRDSLVGSASATGNRWVVVFDPLGRETPVHAVPFVTKVLGLCAQDLGNPEPEHEAMWQAWDRLRPYSWGGTLDPQLTNGPAGLLRQDAVAHGVLGSSMPGGWARGVVVIPPGGTVFILLPAPETDSEILDIVARLLDEFGISTVTTDDMHAYKSYAVTVYERECGREKFPMVGDSVQLAPFYRDLVAASLDGDEHVLIVGGTGTGKELASKILHGITRRREGGLVTMNCAGLTRELAHSQLFGHVKGAFTGALKDRQGLVEKAEGGTLFLDEIQALNPDVRNALLRFLQDGSYQRLGEEGSARNADVRVVAATNDVHFGEDQETVTTGFVQRFLHRVTIPPLGDRPEDIPKLVSAFLEEVEYDLDSMGVTPGLRNYLIRGADYDESDEPPAEISANREAHRYWQSRSWEDGNVRELRAEVRKWVFRMLGREVAKAGGRIDPFGKPPRKAGRPRVLTDATFSRALQDATSIANLQERLENLAGRPLYRSTRSLKNRIEGIGSDQLKAEAAKQFEWLRSHAD